MFTPQTTHLKNGKEISIRECQVDDAEQLREMVGAYIPDSPFIPMLPEEFTISVEDEERWIKSFLDNANSILLVAEYDGKLIGNIDLTGNQRKVMSHTCLIGMGMLKEWRNTGLGTALMSSAIDWATNNPIVELLWLQVYTANRAGMALYHKMGFKEIGIISQFFKHGDTYFDNLTMSLSVKKT